MRQSGFAIPVLVLLGITGCAGKMPQSADEFRQALPGAFMGELETYEVDRASADIGKTFQQYAPRCLNVRLETRSQTSMSYQYIVTQYTPTVVINNERAELHIQEKHEQGVMAVYEEPAAGHYLMVIDATSIGDNRSRIDIYRPSMGFDAMLKAVKNWIEGTDVGCPDLTR